MLSLFNLWMCKSRAGACSYKEVAASRDRELAPTKRGCCKSRAGACSYKERLLQVASWSLLLQREVAASRDQEVAPTECKRRNELRDYKRMFCK